MDRISRMNLSGGKLGKPLWTRSDLEQYHKGNHQQTNFLSTPYGGIERRPPASLLGSVPSKDISIGASGSITLIQNNPSVGIDIHTTSAGASKVGDEITLADTTNYNGTHTILGFTGDTIINIDATYVADETSGAWSSTRTASYEPDVVRGFPFVYDIDTKYVVLLVGYVATGEEDKSYFEIFGDDGSVKDSIASTYLSTDFYEIDYKQVNDVIMFAHRSYPTAAWCLSTGVPGTVVWSRLR